MTRLGLLLASSSLLCSFACSKKSGDFEGEIALRISRPEMPPSELLFEASEGRVRVGMSQADGPAYALVKPDGMAVFVMESKKAWSDLNMAKSRAQVEKDNPTGPPSVNKTGKLETIAGQRCEVWEIKHTSGKRTDACISEGLVGFDLGTLMPGAGPFTSQSSEEIAKRKLFPLRSVEIDAKGQETSRMEVTRVERKSLDKSRFEVPKDFTYIPAK